MNPRVVMISKIFAPELNIAAIRTTKIAKYLSLEGYILTVITSLNQDSLIDEILQSDIDFIHEIINFREYRTINFIRDLKKAKKKQLIEDRQLLKSKENSYSKIKINKFLSWTSLILEFLFDYIFYIKNVRRVVRSSLGNDYVISSFGPMSNHLLAKKIKRAYPNIIWVADFRDQVFIPNETPFMLRRFYKNFAKKICKEANLVTAVSIGVLKGLHLNNNIKQKVLTNGFDKDDLNVIKVETDHKRNRISIVKSKIRFLYAGTLYDSKRDIRDLLIALNEIIEKTPKLSDRIVIEYYGPDQVDFRAQTMKLKLNFEVISNGKVSRANLFSKYNESDALILLSWNSHEEEGVMTGKIYELLMFNKPIIALVTGNKPLSAIKTFVEEYDLGYCYERSENKIEFNEFKEYLSNLIDLIDSNNHILNGEVRNSNLQEFDYKYIVRELDSVLRSLRK